jgi:hypothetical protein
MSRVSVSLRKSFEFAETSIPVAKTYHSMKSRHSLELTDIFIDLDVYITFKMFLDFVQRHLDIFKHVLDPVHVLFINRSKAVSLQRVVVGGG